MDTLLIDKYNKLLNSLENAILRTDDETLKEMSKESFVKFTCDLAEIEKKDITYYQERLEKVGVDENIIEKTIEQINSFSVDDTLNDASIDDGNSFDNDNSLLDENNEVSVEQNDEPTDEVEQVEKVDNNKNDDLDLYILENVYRNKDQNIGDEFQKLMIKLQEDFENPNELSISTWVKNYMSFVDKYKNVLDENKLIQYMKKRVKEFDVNNKFNDKIDDYIEKGNIDIPKQIDDEVKDNNVSNSDNELETETKENKTNEKEAEPLKIVGIKKAHNSKARNIALGITALLGVGALAAVADMSIFAVIPAYIIFKLLKKHGVSNVKLQSFLKKHKFTIDKETNELIDKDGNKITEETVGKSKYEMIKNELFKLTSNVKNGMINKDYKKNKLASILLNSKLVQKFKNRKQKSDVLEVENDTIENIEQENIRKGLGKC